MTKVVPITKRVLKDVFEYEGKEFDSLEEFDIYLEEQQKLEEQQELLNSVTPVEKSYILGTLYSWLSKSYLRKEYLNKLTLNYFDLSKLTDGWELNKNGKRIKEILKIANLDFHYYTDDGGRNSEFRFNNLDESREMSIANIEEIIEFYKESFGEQ